MSLKYHEYSIDNLRDVKYIYFAPGRKLFAFPGASLIFVMFDFGV
jgi:hypothetical protein